MSLQRVPINNFRGGLNTRDGPFDLQANESPDLLNVTVSSLVGQLETRKGKERADKEGMPIGETVDFMKQVVIGNGKRFLMMSINGSIYSMGPAGVVTKRFKGTAGTIWDFELYSDAAFKDWVYCGNGVDAMQKWDGEAAASVEWKATTGAIPKGGVLCVWENRMFISYVSANVQRVYFSEFGDPEATIKEYGFVDVRGPEDDLDAIQDLCVLGGRLIVLKRRNIFYISSAVTMLNRRIGSPGVWSRFQVAELEDKLYFFNPQGIFSTGGVEVAMESGSINNYFPDNLNNEKYTQARLITTKDTYPRLLLAVTTNASLTNDTLIEMIPHINFRRIGGRRYLLLPAFMLHSIAADSLACWNPTATSEKLVATTQVSGLLPPEGAVIDSFKRATEKPLSNGGKWSSNGSGDTGEIDGAQSWTPDASGTANALWNAAIQINPEISVDILAGSNLSFWLYVCMDKIAKPNHKGYQVTYESHTETIEVRAFTSTGSAPLIGSASGIILLPSDSFGVTVRKGVITVWRKREGAWIKLLQVNDTSATEGFVGMGGDPQVNKAKLQNFTLGETGVSISRAYYIFQGETDDGLPIQAHWKSSWMAIQEQEPKERVRRLNVELSGDAFVDVFRDFEENPAFSKALPKEGERGEFDEPVAEGLAYRFTRVRPETRGRFHQIQFRTDSEGKPFQINAAELVIRGGKEH